MFFFSSIDGVLEDLRRRHDVGLVQRQPVLAVAADGLDQRRRAGEQLGEQPGTPHRHRRRHHRRRRRRRLVSRFAYV